MPIGGISEATEQQQGARPQGSGPFLATDRVLRLRKHALDQASIDREEPELLWARAWLAASDEPWQIVRRAKATAGILRGMRPRIDADELLVGKFSEASLTPGEAAELAHWRREVAPAVPLSLGQRAHMAIDYDQLLQLGLLGIRGQIEGFRARLRLEDPADLERDAFYRSCLIALDSLGDLAQRYADCAERLAAVEADLRRAGELREIARTCRRVPENPPETFREALQAVHLVTFALCAGQRMLLFQLGRPDRYLLPFYRHDLAAGRLTPELAQELIDCLSLLLGEYTPRGLAVGYMLGGRDASGLDATSELTWLFLESVEHCRAAYPSVGLAAHPDMPPALLRRAAELLAAGLTHPAIFNDTVITSGLRRAGLPPAEACLYVQSTCVEITPIASSNVYVASPYINLVQLLHDVLGVPPIAGAGSDETSGGQAAGEAPAFATFADLLAAYRRRLAEAIREGVIAENVHQATRRYHGGFPLLSCFVNDCLPRGLDIDQGGARHNWVEPSFVGLANLVDSLAAIRAFVFEADAPIALADLARALRDDFAGRAPLRQALLNRAPKYGNDDDRADELAIWATESLVEACAGHRTYLGGSVHPGLFCWVMHERLGRATRASADGRPAGAPLADGSGGAQGRERHGPTAALRSTTKWDHRPMLGGVAVNLKLSPGPGGLLLDALVSLIATFVREGGFELQVNVVDRATLLAAKARPEEHRDLVVRVAGYSDYFVGLPEATQDEIIARTEHCGA